MSTYLRQASADRWHDALWLAKLCAVSLSVLAALVCAAVWALAMAGV